MIIHSPSRLRLTKRAVDTLTPTDKDYVIFDADLPGFGIKITPSGRKVFLVQYRYPPGRTGRIRRYTIGAYGESLTPDQARGIAVQVKGKLAAGVDPVSERDAVFAEAAKAAQEEKRTHASSVEAVAAAFIERHAKPRLRSWRGYERMLQNHVLREWGPRPILEIRRSDVTTLLDGLASEQWRALLMIQEVLHAPRTLYERVSG
jgi:hypothetical protein